MQILSQLQDPASLPPAYLAEIRALERERSPEVAEQALIHLSNRLERAGDLERAAELYGILAGHGQTPIAEQARDRLRAMNGNGPGGALRWEFLANRFSEQLLDPASLVGMGVAGLVFRGARLWTLSRLAQTSIPTMPLAASLMATGVGLSFETMAFVLSSGLTELALGQQRDWSFGGYSRDFASTFILLGSMRCLGGAVPLLLRSRLGTSPLALPWRSQIPIGLAQQGAMFGGIVASRYLQSRIGLSESDENVGAALSESLATLIHFNVAGRLAHAAFGPRWAAYERDMDWRSVELGNFPPPIPRVRDIHGQWVRPDYLPRPDRLRSIPSWSRHLRSILTSPMWMTMGAGGLGPIGPSSRPLSRGPAGLLRAIRSQIATSESDAALMNRIQSAMRQLPDSEARLIQAYHLDQPARTMRSLDAELGVSRTTTEKIRSRAYAQITQLVTQRLAEERGLENRETLHALLDRPVGELGLTRDTLRLLHRESIFFVGEVQAKPLGMPYYVRQDYLSYTSASHETARALRGVGLEPRRADSDWVPPDLRTRGIHRTMAYSSRRQLHLALDLPVDNFLGDAFQRQNWGLLTFSHREELSRALQALEIHSTAELLRRDPAELVRSRGLTLLQTQELVRCLGNEGLTFGMDNQGWAPFGTRPLGEARPRRKVVREARQEPLDGRILGFRAEQILHEQGIDRLGKVALRTTQELKEFGLFPRDLRYLDQLLAEAGLQTRVEE